MNLKVLKRNGCRIILFAGLMIFTGCGGNSSQETGRNADSAPSAINRKNLNRMEIMRYDGPLNRHGWKFLESKAGEMVYVPFEGYYESKGGRVQSPIVKLNKKAGEPAYYSVEFKAKAKDHCYWWVDLFDAQGKPLPDINSAVYPTDDEVAYKEMIYVQGKADAMQFAFISKEGVSVQDIVVKKVSAKEAAEWCDALYRDMPKLKFTEQAPAFLPRTAAALRDGTPWRIVMLGDSIMNDSFNSVFQSLVKRDFPNSNCDFVISVRGSTGCWFYQKPENFKAYVADLKPDLLIIGGISNPKEGDWTGAIIKVIEQARRIGCEVLLLSPPLSLDWRPASPRNPALPADNITWSENTKDCHGKQLLQQEPYLDVARKTGVPFWNLTPLCADYLASSGKPLGWFNRDTIHNNDRGKQVIGRILQSCFRLLKQEP